MWPEKVEYSISTPTKAVIFGTAVQVNFRFIPLLKGLKIADIVTELTETQEMTVEGPRTPRKHRKITRLIARDEHLPGGDNIEDIEAQEEYVVSRTLAMPQTLTKCLQSVDALGIRIGHYLNFKISMLNPDGHSSEVSANDTNTTLRICC